MKLSKKWIEHLADGTGLERCAGSRSLITHRAICPCGEKMPKDERHEHCPGCGGLVSIGTGKTIASWTIKI